MEKVLRIFGSFYEAEKADFNDWENTTADERLNAALDMMRPYYEAYPRLERILRIVDQTQCPILDSWGMAEKLVN